MELKLRFIFIISCWLRGPTPYRIRRCPDWGYLGADKFERGLSQVPGPTRIHPKLFIIIIYYYQFEEQRHEPVLFPEMYVGSPNVKEMF
jgi:hypothetical protein